MVPAGIYIPKKSSSGAALYEDKTGKNLLAVRKEGRPRRHSMSADPAHLAMIAASAAVEEEKAKSQRSAPLFPPRRPSLLPRSPYSITDCGLRLEPSLRNRNPILKFGGFSDIAQPLQPLRV